MSCFFDSLTQALSDQDLKILNVQRNTPNVIQSLKVRNTLTQNVSWQGSELTKTCMTENFEHVKSYDAKTYNKGYLTSSCDPFLCLACELFKWEIKFKYMNSIIIIKHDKSVRRVTFSASNTHFSHP